MPISRKDFETYGFTMPKKVRAILEFLSENRNKAYSMEELCKKFKQSKQSTFRHLQYLKNNGLIEHRTHFYAYRKDIQDMMLNCEKCGTPLDDEGCQACLSKRAVSTGVKAK